MNAQWIYFAAAFGVLLSLEDKKESLSGLLSFSKTFALFLVEAVELCGYTTALLLVHYLIFQFQPESMDAYRHLIKFPLFWLGAYAICRLAKKSAPFFVTVVSICFFALNQPPGTLGLLWFFEALKIALALTLFHAALQGVRRRLVFSSVPRAAEGLPVLIASAFILALAASGFAHILL